MNRYDQLVMLFSKDVSEYDRRHSLALPTSLMGYVWPPEVVHERVREFRVVDIYDQSWIFEGHLRWGNDGYPRPEVYGPGWRAFIRDKGLRLGDKLIFYLPAPKGTAPPPVDTTPLVFVLSVMRTIRLGGKTLSGHVAPSNN